MQVGQGTASFLLLAVSLVLRPRATLLLQLPRALIPLVYPLLASVKSIFNEQVLPVPWRHRRPWTTLVDLIVLEECIRVVIALLDTLVQIYELLGGLSLWFHLYLCQPIFQRFGFFQLHHELTLEVLFYCLKIFTARFIHQDLLILLLQKFQGFWELGRNPKIDGFYGVFCLWEPVLLHRLGIDESLHFLNVWAHLFHLKLEGSWWDSPVDRLELDFKSSQYSVVRVYLVYVVFCWELKDYTLVQRDICLSVRVVQLFLLFQNLVQLGKPELQLL